MTGLTLNVVSVDAAPPTQALACQFDVNGGTIGRDESNSMPLPDKHRRVSRLHATVSFPGGVATITNSSASLPIAVGEQQLDSGESVPVAHGIMIEIGPYLLQAVLPGVTVAPATFAPPPRAAAPMQHAAAPVAVAPVARVAAAPAVPLATARELDLGALFPPSAAGSPTAVPMPAVGDDPLQALLAGAPAAPMPALGGAPAGTVSRAGGGAYEQAQMPPPPALFPPAPAATTGDYLTGAAPASAGADPFANLLEGIGAPPGAFPTSGGLPAGASVPAGLSADPLAALGGAPTGAMPSLSHSVPGGAHTTGAASSAFTGSTGATIPDDFNPFDLPSDTQRNSADPLAGLLGQPTATIAQTAGAGPHVAPPIDSLFQGAPGVVHDPLMVGSAAAPVSGSADGLGILLGAGSGNTDPMALFAPAEASPGGHRPMRDDALELGAAFAPPVPQPADQLLRAPAPTPILPQDPFAGLIAAPPTSASPVMQPPAPQLAVPAAAAAVTTPAPAVVPAAFASLPAAPVPVAPQRAAAPPQAASSVDALTEAFLRGAGLPPSALPQGLTPEVMMMVGSVLRSATAGAVDMLAARAATKREVQASVTIISVQANNPLKFLPNADAAMLQLLGKKMPGFMRADVAMRDAFDDLRAHEVGVIAGTRAALTEVLGKFDPAVLGEKLARGSVLESLMPSARKAKLWDMYLERYLQIRREAEDDFQSIFGRAFVQAYERETARIKGETPAVGGER